jgi:MraZ protein
MLLTGTYERALDQKLRFALPRNHRDALQQQLPLILTPGTDGSLALFPQQAFAALAAKLAARSPTGQDVRAFSRLLYAQSQSVELDAQGRIRVPPELARSANLGGEVVLLGVGDHLEIWNKSRWEAYVSDLSPKYDQLAEAALSDAPAPLKAPPTNIPAEPNRPLQPR